MSFKILASILAGVMLPAAAQAEPLVVTGATLIDGTGTVPVKDAVIVMDNGRFLGAGPRGTISVPSAAKTIDAKGKYVVPGLMNANVHLIDGIMLMGIGGIEYLARYENALPQVIEEGSQIALANGMTTLFDTWNALEPAKIARDRIARGEVQGARIFIAGNILGMGGPFTADFCLRCAETMSATFAKRMNDMFEAGVGRELSGRTPEGVGQAVREYTTKGVDFVKFAVSDHTPYGPYLTFSEAQMRAIVDETRKAGLGIQTHTTSYESLRIAVDLGVDLMQHCTITMATPISDEIVAKMKAKKVWCEIQPVTARFLANNPQMAKRLPVMEQNIVKLIKAKAPILMGTDAGVTDPDVIGAMPETSVTDRPWTLGNDHFLWFEAMVEKGMAPMDAIMAATSNVAAAYKKPDLGVVAQGKIADLIILERNPLADISNMRSISMVIKDGAVVDRDRLPNPTVVSKRLNPVWTN